MTGYIDGGDNLNALAAKKNFKAYMKGDVFQTMISWKNR